MIPDEQEALPTPAQRLATRGENLRRILGDWIEYNDGDTRETARALHDALETLVARHRIPDMGAMIEGALQRHRDPDYQAAVEDMLRRYRRRMARSGYVAKALGVIGAAAVAEFFNWAFHLISRKGG